MSLLQSTAITGCCNYIKKMLASAKYKIDSDWYDASQVNVSVTNDIIEVSFTISIPSGSASITRIEIYDRNGDLWFAKTESIVIDTVAEGITYVVRFKIEEVSE